MSKLCLRDEFHVPVDEHGQEWVYLCGNSLGLQPKACRSAIQHELDVWAKYAVEGHFEEPYPWYTYHEFVRESLARIVGAKPSEVVAMNSLTTNLHLLMVSFYKPSLAKHKIMIEGSTFPSDRYAVQSQLAFHGYDSERDLIEIMPDDSGLLSTEQVLAAIDKQGDETALLLFSGVHYLSGQKFDMQAITDYAHRKEIIVGFDLAHAAGNVLLSLHDWDVDFAAWCSYKYLNSGPGGIAGAFVHEKHCQNPKIHRFAGWWGNDSKDRFEMAHDFAPVASADSWQLSNPPIFQLAALRASMEVFDKVDLVELRARGDELTTMLQTLLEQELSNCIEIISPKDLLQRGNQLSLKIKGDARQVHQSLNQQGVICDFRNPDVLRVATAPLYNNERDIELFIERLKGILEA
jgi:kynureninase